MYDAPRVSVLWFLPVLMLSIYTWGYFWPMYIRHSNVSVTAGLGRYRNATRPHEIQYSDGRSSTITSAQARAELRWRHRSQHPENGDHSQPRGTGKGQVTLRKSLRKWTLWEDRISVEDIYYANEIRVPWACTRYLLVETVQFSWTCKSIILTKKIKSNFLAYYYKKFKTEY